MKAVIKPQYVDQIPKAAKGSVQVMLDKKDDLKNQDEVCAALGNIRKRIYSEKVIFLQFCLLVSDLTGVKNREIENLSGGELQRFAIGIVCIQKADV